MEKYNRSFVLIGVVAIVFLSAAIVDSGARHSLSTVVRQRTRAALPVLPVVMYHRVNNHTVHNDGGRILPTLEFEEQLMFLREAGYTTLRACDYLAIQAGELPCPARPIMLTFDDGYDDNLYEAYPLLRRYGMKATVFVIVNSIGSVGHMKAWHLERMDPSIFEIGSHTMNHRALAGVSSRCLEYELVDSRLELEFMLGRPVLSFSFPFGSHDEQAVAAAAAAGYRVAFTTERGINHWHGSPLRLNRVSVHRGMSLKRFAAAIGYKGRINGRVVERAD